MVNFIATKKMVKVLTLEKNFIENLYKLYGLIVGMVSDRDRKYNNHFWREVFKNLDITLSMSTIDNL